MSAGVRAAVEAALTQRLGAAAAALDVPVCGEVEADAAALADAAHDGSSAWLVLTAFLGRFPSGRELEGFRRGLLLAPRPVDALLASASTAQRRASGALRRMRLVSDRAVVDVGHVAVSPHNTGIQRVVRRTLPEWTGRAVDLVAWTRDDRGFRELTAREREQVLAWGRPFEAESVPPPDDLVVPWGTTVLLPEVATAPRLAPLAALAAHSGNRVGMIGYDLIPLVSADLVDVAESDRTAHYLEVVKHADTVAAISESAAAEFRGFVAQLPAQGLTGPEVVAVPLGESPLDAAASAPASSDDAPLMLCVGSHDPRKNQTSVLQAAVLLHRAGVRFRLVFVGGGSREHTARFDREVARLRASGMEVEARRRVGDAELAALYAEARATVMVSLHEGYGLPVVESLAKGVPVLASDYGALAEVAAAGGCVLVDPRDPTAIAEGMRRLVVDDALVDRLRAEARARPARTWGDYAAELWAALMPGGEA